MPERGGSTDKYSWDQSLKDVTIEIELDDSISRSDYTFNITSTHISLTILGEEYFNGKLHKRVIPADCFFMVEDDVIEIILTKEKQDEWWSCIVEGEATVDTKEIPAEETRLQDLDPEARQAVEKMMFEQKFKQNNKSAKEANLRKFMEAHPEMDFSKAKISGIDDD
eukprot:TRINITY_DN201_c0_g1_i1.p1 TRINITY_DN201_c0_g1~~TRINITY_DN201_c0_g1_i1.p1  ORF type:complete len:175 (+),score=62.42 TRINITY_DN201_c0_g1_i1:27-527(+)